MKRSLVISFFLPFFLCVGGALMAQDIPTSWEGTISARTLNVRAGPGKSRDVVVQLKRGDRVIAFDEQDKWVHIRDFDGSGKTGWVSRAFVSLPKSFMSPAFGDTENEFLEWASARGDLSVVSVEADNRLSLVLEKDSEEASAAAVAREVACAYRERLSLDVPVVATVWPAAGPQDGWIVQVSCP